MKKENYLNLFRYLREFSMIRINIDRDILNSSKYLNVIWFSDLSHTSNIEAASFSHFDRENEFWLQVKRPGPEPKKPSFPKLPKALVEWIEVESLLDEVEGPKLKERIFNGTTWVYSSESKEVKNLFEVFFENHWFQELETYKNQIKAFRKSIEEYKDELKLYGDLFTIFNKASQFKDEFELILGFGLLHYHRDVNSTFFRRHLFTTPAEISFDDLSGAITIGPSIEYKITIESEFIDNQPVFEAINLAEAEKVFKENLSKVDKLDVFGGSIDHAIQGYVGRFSQEGEYKNYIGKGNTVETIPNLTFSPALLFRKRDSKGIARLYKEIIQQIENGPDGLSLPVFDKFFGVINSSESTNQEVIYDSLDNINIYFPKPYNDEQFQIALKAKRNKLVVVQGPPGTGKSHTIANLICDLIANGNRVLVTAQTERALQVLGDKLPEGFRDLTVSLVTGTPRGKKSGISESDQPLSLHKTINAIKSKSSENLNLSKAKSEIEKLENEKQLCIKNLGSKKQEWYNIRISDVENLEINENYRGSLLEIAQQVESDKPIYSWYHDKFSGSNNQEFWKLLDAYFIDYKEFPIDERTELEKRIPEPDKLIKPDSLEKYNQIKRFLQSVGESQNLQLKRPEIGFDEAKTDLIRLQSLLEILEKNGFYQQFKIAANFSGTQKAIHSVIQGINTELEKLNSFSLDYLDRNVKVEQPANKSLYAFKNDVRILKDYASKGNPISGPIFQLKRILADSVTKTSFYLINSKVYNGRGILEKSEADIVYQWIEVQQVFEKISQNAPEFTILPKFRLTDSFKAYNEYINELQEIDRNLDIAIEIVQKLEKNLGNRFISGDLKEVEQWLNTLHFFEQNLFLESYDILIEKSIDYLNSNDFQSVSRLLSAALQNRDNQAYRHYWNDIESSVIKRQRLIKFKEVENSLKQLVPQLLCQISADEIDEEKRKSLNSAFMYRQAEEELNRRRLLNPDKILAEIKSLENRIQKLNEEIGLKRTWLCLRERLSENKVLIQHLNAIEALADKVKGESARAQRNRRSLQEHLQKTVEAVPCWVMPLYKAAEAIPIEPDSFDYVIVDEASQLSAEALFLMYIGKNIIVVGDHKQTSPEYIGIKDEDIFPKIQKYLGNMPFGKFLSIEYSFYDQTKLIAYSSMILREHFRSMPEIIEFSNQNFYKPFGTELYPLKQYNEARLPPLQSFFCEGASVKGSDSNIHNLEEAVAIAKKISELCNQPAYKNKTMGVIALQGNLQAIKIEELILKEIGRKEFLERKIVCGNSANFQGDERDIMFLSLVTAPNHSNRQPLTKAPDERRFNVAASRAKEQVWLFHSVKLEELFNSDDLRKKLLGYFLGFKEDLHWEKKPIEYPSFGRSINNLPTRFRSWFEVDVFNDLVSKNYQVIPNYKVVRERYEIDLVPLLPNGSKIAIECDGDLFHGPDVYDQDMKRQNVLERCGWRFFRIRGSEYYSSKAEVMNRLWKFLEDAGGKIESKAEPVLHEQLPVLEFEKDKPVIIKEKIKQETRQTEIQFFPIKKVMLKTGKNLEAYAGILVFTSTRRVHKVYNSLAFNNQGKLKTDVQKISNSELVKFVLDKIKLEQNETPVYVGGLNSEKGFMIFGFKDGRFSKIPMSSYDKSRMILINGFRQDSELVFVKSIENDIEIVVKSTIGKVLILNTNHLSIQQTASSQGIQVMKSKNGSSVASVLELNQCQITNPQYYRTQTLPAIGYYLKDEDNI